jgi:hypothetical protein
MLGKNYSASVIMGGGVFLRNIGHHRAVPYSRRYKYDLPHRKQLNLKQLELMYKIVKDWGTR